MEQAPDPPVQAGPGGRWQLQGAARSGDQHLHVVARARAQLPFPADLRTLGTATMNRLSEARVTGMRLVMLATMSSAGIAAMVAGDLCAAESAVLHLTNGGFVAGDLKGS